MRIAARLATLALAATLAGCGFQLRGPATFPFKSIAVPGQSTLLTELQRNIASGSNAKLVTRTEDAEAIFAVLGEAREKVILSLNTQGRVREFQLRYRLLYRVHDGKGGDYIAPTELVLRRDITFNDQVLAKENEEAILFREMQSDMVQQLIRRMQAAKLRRPGDEDE